MRATIPQDIETRDHMPPCPLSKLASFVSILWISIALTLSAQAQTPPPPEAIAVAELRSLTLTRRDWEAEGREWEAEVATSTPREHAAPSSGVEEEEAIVVSNHCGEATATFRVLRSTAPLPREMTFTLSIGEFCEPPIDFDASAWLLVLDGATGELRARYPAFVWEDGALYAISEFGPGRNHSPEVIRLLTPTPLTEPLEYTVYLHGDALTRHVDRRPSLELRDGKVWLVSAIPLASIFPGFTVDDIWP